VEAEQLRKKVSDKEVLICQAAKALELADEEYQREVKKLLEERDIEKKEIKSRIEELETVS
jgi:hypothetical protein